MLDRLGYSLVKKEKKIPAVFHSQSEVGDATLSIPLDENVLRLDVSMSNARLAFGRTEVVVEMRQARDHRQSHFQRGRVV